MADDSEPPQGRGLLAVWVLLGALAVAEAVVGGIAAAVGLSHVR